MSLSTQILIGLALGILTGLFFGELVADWKIVGDLYVQFLQITVLPYIVVSLIAGFAKLTLQQVSLLAVRAGIILVVIWSITLIVIYVVSLSFPALESTKFFSNPAVTDIQTVNLIELFIPTNIFYSLGHRMVPAVVIFSLLLGIALISVTDKDIVIRVFDALSDALTNINEFVVKATPLGIYFIAASAAGTLTIDELSRVQVYLVTYIAIALVATLWIFPALISIFSGIPFKTALFTFKDALLTAFATGNQFVVLPLIAEKTKELLNNHFEESNTADSAVDVIVPISFNFPSLGKLLVILFVLFAGWFNNVVISASDYLLLAINGVFGLFGSIHIAVPYLLNLMQIPADMYQLFLVTGVVVGRFGAMLAALHIICIGILGSLALTGQLRVNFRTVTTYMAGTAAVLLILVIVLKAYFSSFTTILPEKDLVLKNITQLHQRVTTEVLLTGSYFEGGALPRTPSQIKEDGLLRVGYRSSNLPCTFLTDDSRLVGFDIEMMQILAEDLSVSLQFIPFERNQMKSMLDRGEIDLAVSCLASLPDQNLDVYFTLPYLNLRLGLVVKDHDRSKFSSPEEISSLPAFTVATVATHYFEPRLSRLFPNATPVVLESAKEFFEKDTGADALLTSVEEGSAYVYRFPEFTVIESTRGVTIPAGVAMAKGNVELLQFMNNWIRLKKGEGTLEDLQAYWMYGGITEKKQPRWSIIKDVLHWVDE